MKKDYLKNKTYDELKRKKIAEEKPDTPKTNPIELNDSDCLEIVELFRDGKSWREIQKTWRKNGKVASKKQIQNVEKYWKEELEKKRPEKDGGKQEKKV